MRNQHAPVPRKGKPKPKRHDTPIKPGQLLLFKRQVLELLGNPSYTTVWSWMVEGRFPLAVELGPPGGRSTMIAWYADEVHEWIATRPRRKLGQHEFRGRRETQEGVGARELERIDLLADRPVRVARGAR